MNDRWAPDKEKVDKCKNLIKDTFPAHQKPDDLFLTDCAKITVFLMDKEAFRKQLKKLDTVLQEKLQEAHKTLSEKGAMHVFRVLLEKELSEVGFQPKFGQIYGRLSSDDFRAAIDKGLLFKDSYFRGSEHGEYSHAIQWLMITWQNKETPFLSESVGSIFKKFECNGNLWDFIVDNINEKNFRSPEILNPFIQKNENDYPNLSHLLKNRATKPKPASTENKKYQYHETKPGFFEPKQSPAEKGDSIGHGRENVKSAGKKGGEK